MRVPHRRSPWLACGAILVTSLTGCARQTLPQAVQEQRHLAAPTVLPHVTVEMNAAGFWIGRLAEPDEMILSEDQIRQFNCDIRTRLRLTKDIASFPAEFDGPNLRAILQRQLDGFRRRTLYDPSGRKADTSFYAPIEENVQLPSIDSRVNVRFALVTRNADQRLLPTAEGLYAEPGDIDFDQIQNSALDVGMPVAVLHETADGQWYYVTGPSSDGWIETEKLAFCSQDELRTIMSRPYVTVVRAKGNVFLDSRLTQYYGFIRMGSKLPLAGDSAPDVTPILLPTRRDDGMLQIRTGYLHPRETVAGHLPYTPRHIIQQAFEMLNTPYGWGGANGQQDCSQFVQQVFATVGVALPRNSSDQARVGSLLARFELDDSDDKKRDAVLTRAVPGTCLLHMNGHVMLYIGSVAGRPYAIHDVWAYREPAPDGADILRIINRVAVTDLCLGDTSRIGSLLRRLKSIRALAPAPEN
jgi:hypothetical protein